MKKLKFNGKLSLNKETIAKLNDEQMGAIIGGSASITTAVPCCASVYAITSCGRQGCEVFTYAATCQPGCGTNTCG